ncbi:MAG: cyclic pyranopterin monophosphate synthase MoaC [Elusimicrobia bacterium]|nr:cyclic pyranopterin monophosphate synthase MoaC [Elusimicrobiota bacterium]
MAKLTHVDAEGRARMVDVGAKRPQHRAARAEGFIRLSPAAAALVRGNAVKKGDVLTVAEVAGIQAGKKTSELIPLCHPLALTKLDVKAEVEAGGVRVTSLAKCIGPTGVEMEALTAVCAALLSVYDMCKAADKGMVIESVRLIEKVKSDEAL